MIALGLGLSPVFRAGRGGGGEETFAQFVADVFSGSPSGYAVNVADADTRWRDDAGTVPVTSPGQTIGRLSDTSGNGNHWLQSNSSKRPGYGSDGSFYWMTGDGLDDFMRATFSISQPWERISALQQVSWVDNHNIFNGGTDGAGLLYQEAVAPNITISSGSDLRANPDPAVGADFIAIERHDGANSRIRIDNNPDVTGNAGTALPGGITVFANRVDGNPGNIRLYASIMRAGSFTDDEIARAVTIMAKLQGRIL